MQEIYTDDKIATELTKILKCSEEELRNTLPVKYINLVTLAKLIGPKTSISSISHIIHGRRKTSVFRKDMELLVYRLGEGCWFFKLDNACNCLLPEFQNEKIQWIINKSKQLIEDKSNDWLGLRYKKYYKTSDIKLMINLSLVKIRSLFSRKNNGDAIYNGYSYEISTKNICDFLEKHRSTFPLKPYCLSRRRAGTTSP